MLEDFWDVLIEVLLKEKKWVMFEKELFEKIKKEFKLDNVELNFGYGGIDSETQLPYIIQDSLEMNGSRHVLANNDDFTDGKSLIQWKVCSADMLNSDLIVQELFKFILMTNQVNGYRLGLKLLEENEDKKDLNNDLSLSKLVMRINYTKEN